MVDWMHRFFSAGDAPFFFSEQIQSMPWFPVVWNDTHGLGESVIFRLWYDYPLQIITKLLFSLGFDWWFIDKFFWFGAVLFCLVSSYRLSTYFFPSKLFRLIAVMIYCTNTYALMIFGGGQLGVYWGYSLLPYFLVTWLLLSDIVDKKEYIFYKINKENIGLVLQGGLLTSFLIASDLRFGFIGIFLVSMLFMLKIIQHKKNVLSLIGIKNGLFIIITVGLITVLLHLYWILPATTSAGVVKNLSEDISGVGMVRYLSFADLSHSISLLHPNWPENLFGYIHFFKQEFLLIPILAFITFFFAYQKKTIFLGFIGIIGALLAKGTNDPFGRLYELLFQYVPGFVMFRDPTKFYGLIALSYSILIPNSLLLLTSQLIFKFKKYKKYLYLSSVFIFLIWWFSLHDDLLRGNLTGNFSPPKFTNDYSVYKDLMSKDDRFGRVLWIPEHDRFAYRSSEHPFIDGNMLIKTSTNSSLIDIATSSAFLEESSEIGIRYIAIATDIAKKLYYTDYLYDDRIPLQYSNSFDELALSKVPGFETLRVYDLGDSKSLITDSLEKSLSYSRISSAKYLITVPKFRTNSIKVLMNFDPNWRLYLGKLQIAPLQTPEGFMSFEFPDTEVSLNAELLFVPQYYANIGAIISGVSLVIVILCLIMLKMKN